MPSNPYSGLTLAELNARRTYLLGVLNGTSMESFGGQGSNFKRRLPSLEEARQDLALVADALYLLNNPATPQVSRTIGDHRFGRRSS